MFQKKLRRLRWKTKRAINRLIPFKGQYAYEVQIGPVVFMLLHTLWAGRQPGLFRIWLDPMWWR